MKGVDHSSWRDVRIDLYRWFLKMKIRHLKSLVSSAAHWDWRFESRPRSSGTGPRCYGLIWHDWGVSWNRGTPVIIHFNGMFPCKPTIWGALIYGNPHLTWFQQQNNYYMGIWVKSYDLPAWLGEWLGMNIQHHPAKNIDGPSWWAKYPPKDSFHITSEGSPEREPMVCFILGSTVQSMSIFYTKINMHIIYVHIFKPVYVFIYAYREYGCIV